MQLSRGAGTPRERARRNSITRDGAAAATGRPGPVARVGTPRERARRNSVTRDGAAVATGQVGPIARVGTPRERARRNSITRDGAAAATGRAGPVARVGTSREQARSNFVTDGTGAILPTITPIIPDVPVAQHLEPEGKSLLHTITISPTEWQIERIKRIVSTITQKQIQDEEARLFLHQVFLVIWRYEEKNKLKEPVRVLLDGTILYKALVQTNAFNGPVLKTVTENELHRILDVIPIHFYPAFRRNDTHVIRYDITRMYTKPSDVDKLTLQSIMKHNMPRTSAPANFVPRPQHDAAAVEPAADATTPRTPAEASAGDSVAVGLLALAAAKLARSQALNSPVVKIPRDTETRKRLLQTNTANLNEDQIFAFIKKLAEEESHVWRSHLLSDEEVEHRNDAIHKKYNDAVAQLQKIHNQRKPNAAAPH
eukprot:2807134-Rhodomonas_salina.1